MYTKTQTAETLMDAMVAEGIADHFATGMLADLRPPWTDAITSEQSQRLWPRVRRRLKISDMNEIRRILQWLVPYIVENQKIKDVFSLRLTGSRLQNRENSCQNGY